MFECVCVESKEREREEKKEEEEEEEEVKEEEEKQTKTRSNNLSSSFFYSLVSDKVLRSLGGEESGGTVCAINVLSCVRLFCLWLSSLVCVVSSFLLCLSLFPCSSLSLLLWCLFCVYSFIRLFECVLLPSQNPFHFSFFLVFCPYAMFFLSPFPSLHLNTHTPTCSKTKLQNLYW